MELFSVYNNFWERNFSLWNECISKKWMAKGQEN